MKFFQLYNSIIDEAKIDDLLEKSPLDANEKATIRNINDGLYNKSKYVKWLINHAHVIIDWNLDEKVAVGLNYFEKYQSRFDEKDIFKYTTFQLLDKVEGNMSIPTRSERSLKASTDAPKVFENENCTIFRILSEEASKKYGKGTKWCISAIFNNQWDNYYNRQNIYFYFLIAKESSRKFAFAVSSNGEIECYNVEDNRVLLKEVIEMYEVDESIFKHKEIPENEILGKMINGKYVKNEDGTIDVDGDVNVEKVAIKNGKLMFKFGKVNGNFNCVLLNLTSLEGCPKEVGGDFQIHKNDLTSLEGCPISVNVLFCSYNKLTDLKGMPKEVGGDIYLHSNHLTSLVGSPIKVNGTFKCDDNKLKSLEGLPKIIAGNVYLNQNPGNFTKDEIRKVCEISGDIIVGKW